MFIILSGEKLQVLSLSPKHTEAAICDATLDFLYYILCCFDDKYISLLIVIIMCAEMQLVQYATLGN